ncbi:hypothetical protein KPK_1562 [Klebsiella variicola]|uniref:Uncharacterized protein n=1 Tax=Klebsiella variicola (strain 342) TaxID=507522 RepID=B5XP44_KLEV3|nr:hypothetical protein KPK_1562 [Klebsiella variicola]
MRFIASFVVLDVIKNNDLPAGLLSVYAPCCLIILLCLY